MERKLDRQQQGGDQGDDQNPRQKDHRAPSLPNRLSSSSFSPAVRSPISSQPLSPPTSVITTVAATDHHPQGSYGRSYTCVFCKKGFSNAQALGGHMNIHRRDRAKLRESSSFTDEAPSTIEEDAGVETEEPVLPLFVDKPSPSSVSQREVTDSRYQSCGAEEEPPLDLTLRLSSSSSSSLPPPSSSSADMK